MKRSKFLHPNKMTPPPRSFCRVLKSSNAYALIGVIVLSGVLSLSAIQGLKRSAARRAAIELMKAKFEQQAFFRQITKRLYNFHACGATVGSGGSITAIKNHAGVDSFRVGQKYGRGYVNFDGASVSISGNTADFVVTASRYDKKKQQTSGSIKKTWELTLVRGPSSIEGCYIDDAVDTVTEIHEKQSCESIEAMVWSGGKCVLNPFVGKECNNPGKALNQVGLDGVFGCCDVKWVPDHRESGVREKPCLKAPAATEAEPKPEPSLPVGLPLQARSVVAKVLPKPNLAREVIPAVMPHARLPEANAVVPAATLAVPPARRVPLVVLEKNKRAFPEIADVRQNPAPTCAADEEQIGSPGNCKCDEKRSSANRLYQ